MGWWLCGDCYCFERTKPWALPDPPNQLLFTSVKSPQKGVFQELRCAVMKSVTSGLSGLNVHRTELGQTQRSDSSGARPQEAQRVCAMGRDFLNRCWTPCEKIIPGLPPSRQNPAVSWWRWSWQRCAAALRAQRWLSPSLHQWVWCQGQGKAAAAAAPAHHPPTCPLLKVLLAPGEAPATAPKS